MGVDYRMHLIYGYKLDAEEAAAVFEYCDNEWSDGFDYFYSINCEDTRAGAFFGVIINSVEEFGVIDVSEVNLHNSQIKNMLWDWEINSKASEYAPNAKRGLYTWMEIMY